MLRLDSATRTYREGGGIRDVSLHVPPGAIYALVGANGAGKTTTLDVLSGRLFATAGSLRIAERDIPLNRHAPRPGLTFIEYTPVLDRDLTAWEWLGWSAAAKGVPISDLAEAPAWASEMALAADALIRPIATLSDGTRRKVALWAGMLTTHNVLLLDEPMTGLDPEAIHALEAACRRFIASGRSILLSTHLLPQAERLATHVGVIADGRVVEQGTTSKVRGSGTLEERFFATVNA